MSVYYYTPILVETISSGGVEMEQKSPGSLDSDGTTIIDGHVPNGTLSPKCDDSAGRFVLVCPEGTTARLGWEEKTIQEVNTDYPGLIGG